MELIKSFQVNHDLLEEGIYVSRVDNDITTYDLRTRRPNKGDYMDNLTMHSVEHMIATYARNSKWSDHIIYFGPMGCQTGFYLLTRGMTNEEVLALVIDCLQKTIQHKGEVFGKKREQCGNYMNLDLAAAQKECARYLSILTSKPQTFTYKE